ncbi:hypothetical protein TBLA_0F00130 [Henningerozyma blattae CBS 6284]|uniref:DUF3533 domain-containing protein n=1 Tax=Henningerozyma blattae (strain ATCC 34711 / CBS 6284 / DSM 70876 / NBRC 10599 / NRRL Y-10934 / UCD 77-7) TaxID=1071380 RepID=I2H5A5_HENB6|nr:hypothetical protein TBLA_0F00130 [Tetrapisispora blattae CBS 6284]CCH61557.1 hypothetical protein TBLA_0F00130 [Tetrapisispora blattae CBS 6284]
MEENLNSVDNILKRQASRISQGIHLLNTNTTTNNNNTDDDDNTSNDDNSIDSAGVTDSMSGSMIHIINTSTCDSLSSSNSFEENYRYDPTNQNNIELNNGTVEQTFDEIASKASSVKSKATDLRNKLYRTITHERKSSTSKKIPDQALDDIKFDTSNLNAQEIQDSTSCATYPPISNNYLVVSKKQSNSSSSSVKHSLSFRPLSHVLTTVQTRVKKHAEREMQEKIDELGVTDAQRIKTENQLKLDLKEKSMFQRLSPHKGKIFQRWSKNVFYVVLFMAIVLPIFWGCLYRRDYYLATVNFLILVGNDEVQTNPNYTFIDSNNMKLTTNIIPFLEEAHKARYRIFNTTTYMEKFKLQKYKDYDNLTEIITNHVYDQIHRERYWVALNILPNSTQTLLNSFLPENQKENIFSFSKFFQLWFEAQRDPTSVGANMTPIFLKAEAIFQNYYSKVFYPSLLQNISNSNINIFNDLNQTLLAENGVTTFSSHDPRPFDDMGVFLPMEIGLVFALLMTIFQFILHAGLYKSIRKYLTFAEFIVFRIVCQWTTLFSVSLIWVTIAAMFQIDFTKAFGKGGFIVYWMSCYLTMLALAGANENVLSVILTFEQRFIMPWVIFFIILNISSSFFTLALNNQFYRFGYGFPLHNCISIFKVVLCNASKHKMGRNYGVLIAWIAINIFLFPFVLKLCDWGKNRKALKEKEIIEAAKLKKELTERRELMLSHNRNPSNDSRDVITEHFSQYQMGSKQDSTDDESSIQSDTPDTPSDSNMIPRKVYTGKSSN